MVHTYEANEITVEPLLSGQPQGTSKRLPNRGWLVNRGLHKIISIRKHHFILKQICRKSGISGPQSVVTYLGLYYFLYRFFKTEPN